MHSKCDHKRHKKLYKKRKFIPHYITITNYMCICVFIWKIPLVI